jgi:SAM-dependent methyltransferase
MNRLESIPLPAENMERIIPAEVRTWVSDARERIQAFQDRWDHEWIEQFVASDYELVYQTLDWLREERLLTGNRFLEWGAGFAVVSALAARLGFDAVGIEAEPTLYRHGQQTIRDWNQPVELVQGNFLPAGVEDMALDPTLPSLGHPVASAYEAIGLEIDDFSLVFAYPWPGEEDFLADVFLQYAADGALLLQFCGPYDLRLWRKSRKRTQR